MPQFPQKFPLCVLLLILASVSSVSCQTNRVAVVSGFVRDRQGYPMAGAAVRISGANHAVIASAVTDSAGHYLMGRLAPGRYSILAGTSLSAPSAQRVIWLRSGVRSISDIILLDSADQAALLPAHAPAADEPDDEWPWALRSGSNRAILRVLGTSDDGASSLDAREPGSVLQRKVSVQQRGGGFAESGSSLELSEVLGRRAERLRWDIGLRAPQSNSSDAGTGIRVSAQSQRVVGSGGQQQLLLSFQSDPQIESGAGQRGIAVFRSASAQRMHLGERLTLEVGSVLDIVHLETVSVSFHPFVRLRIDPKDGWALGYQMATVPEAQGYDSLDGLRVRLPYVIQASDGPQSAGTQHQEIFLEKRGVKSGVRVRYFRDSSGLSAVQGLLGPPTGTNLVQQRRLNKTEVLDAVEVDPSSSSVRSLLSSKQSQGWSLGVTGEVSPLVHVGATYSRGAAFASTAPGSGLSSMRQRDAQALAMEVAWKIPSTRTKAAVSYRAQTAHTVTSVDAYGTPIDSAYLGFHLRQPLGVHGQNLSWVTLTVDGTNLLQEGIVPVTSGGKTLLLAAAPRSIAAGVAVTF